MVGAVRVLDGKGHTEVAWDTEVPESIEVAAHAFEEAVKAGKQAFDTSSPEGGIAYDAKKGFSTDVQSLTFVPRLAGG